MIRSIKFELIKTFGKKKHLILFCGFLFLVILMVLVFFKTRMDILKPISRELQRDFLMSLLVPDVEKMADGFLFAKITFYPLCIILLPIFSFGMAGEMFASEAQTGTMKHYLSRGFSRLQLVLAKFFTLLLVNIGYCFLFVTISLLIGMLFFGVSMYQLPGFDAHVAGAGLSFLSVSETLFNLYRTAIAFGFSLTAVSMFPFILSSIINKPLGATIGGTVFYFVSFIMSSLPFGIKADFLTPFLETRMTMTCLSFGNSILNWNQIGESFSMMLLYFAIGIMGALLSINSKEF